MARDTLFTNGVIAVKEKSLLGEKILRFPDMTAEEVLRALVESGFGGGADPHDLGALLLGEETALDSFIRTYAPDEADKAYFLAPRDFHNMKALYKARALSVSAEPMLAPEGLRTVAELSEIVTENKPPMPEIPENAAGAEIGAAFDRAMYAYLFRTCRRRKILKNFLTMRVDMTNLLTVFRAESPEEAETLYIEGGSLDADRLRALAAGGEYDLQGPQKAFYEALRAAREKNAPYIEAERVMNAFEEESFFARRFELGGKEPFLYYVLRRRAEIANVRMIVVCLRAGVAAGEIRKRMTGVM